MKEKAERIAKTLRRYADRYNSGSNWGRVIDSTGTVMQVGADVIEALLKDNEYLRGLVHEAGGAHADEGAD